MSGDELREAVKAEYERKKKKNRHYSMRAFSRDLGLTIATLSEFLAGKRRLSKRSLELVRSSLNLPAAPVKTGPRSRRSSHQTISPDDLRKVVSNWLPYALLNVSAVKHHSSSPTWLAAHFGVEVSEIRACLLTLTEMGLIRIEGQKIVRTSVYLTTSNDIPSADIRAFHRQSLRKAETTLEAVDVGLREFTSTTFALSKEDFLEIKNYVRKFRRQVARRFSSSSGDAVYTMSLQLFPLSTDLKDFYKESK
jgi:transcriptional regulator with XRE-family HTH domain